MNIYDETKNLMIYKRTPSGEFELKISPIGHINYSSITNFPEHIQEQPSWMSNHIRTIGYLSSKLGYEMISNSLI